RRRASGCGNESVRVDLRPTLAPRLALAAAGADPPPSRAGRGLPRRAPGDRLPRVDVRNALRARLGRSVVRRQALRGRLRTAAAVRDRSGLARRCRATRSACGRTLRAVPRAAGTPASWAAARTDPHAG